MASTCKKCGAEILWVTMRGTGAKNPLDPIPTDDGYIAVVGLTGISLTKVEENWERSKGRKLYRSHLASQACKKKQAQGHLQLVMGRLGR